MTTFDEFMDMLPIDLRESKSYQAIMEAAGGEADRLQAAYEEILDQTFPQTATWGLYLWERSVGLPENPVTLVGGFADSFLTNTLPNYTYDEGPNNILTWDNVNGRIQRNDGGTYINRFRLVPNGAVPITTQKFSAKFIFNSLTNLMQYGVGKRVVAGNPGRFVAAVVDRLAGNLKLRTIYQETDGTETELFSSVVSISTGVPFWVEIEIKRPIATNTSMIYSKVYSSDPTIPGATVIATHSAALNLTQDPLVGDSVPGVPQILFYPKGVGDNFDNLVQTSEDFQDVSDEDRRSLIIAKKQSTFLEPGKGFAAAIHAIVPAAQIISDYQNSVVRITIPFQPNEYVRAQIDNLIDDIIPAHLDWATSYTGFIAGISRAGDHL